MDRIALLRRLVETNSLLLYHLEEHLLHLVSKEEDGGDRKMMVNRYLLAMKEVQNGFECFLIFKHSQELQDIMQGLNLQVPRIHFETPPPSYNVMTEYPNLLPPQVIQEINTIPSSLPQVNEEGGKPSVMIAPNPKPPCSEEVKVPCAPPGPPQKEKENKKTRKKRSKKELLPPLDIKKIKQAQTDMANGTIPPWPEVPPTPCNEAFDVEQFFQSLNSGQ